MDIGKKIKQARNEAGLNQSELATRMKTHQVTIARLENGERRCSLKNLKSISEITGKPIGWFFGEDSSSYTYDRKLQEELLACVKKNSEELSELKELVKLMSTGVGEGEGRGKRHNPNAEKR
jgi:transcriptional regulator with XRE-family HTH domain